MFLIKTFLFCFLIKLAVTLGFFGNYRFNMFSRMTPAKMKCFGFGIGAGYDPGYGMPDECEGYKQEMNNALHSGFRGIFGKKLFWRKRYTTPMTTTVDEEYDDMDTSQEMTMAMDTTPKPTRAFTATIPTEEPDLKFSPKITEDCGKTMLPPASRVIGGHRAREMEYPWQVGIQKIDTDIDDKVVFHIRGGGAILNNRWVLTAAHVFNDIQLNETRGIFGTISSVNPSKTIKFDKIIIHQNYDMKTFMNDIALLRVDRDMQLFPNQTTVNAVCLPDKYKTYGGMATVTGWGVTNSDEHSESPEFLMSVGLKIIDDRLCSKLYPTFNSTVMLCAGEPDGGKDSCDGDSGGPLLVYRHERAIVVGIVSFGQPRSCGKKNTAAAYTKVSRFVDWITATINAENY